MRYQSDPLIHVEFVDAASGAVIAYTEIKRRGATSSPIKYTKVLDEEREGVSSGGIQLQEKV